jgi:hypothetical protein
MTENQDEMLRDIKDIEFPSELCSLAKGFKDKILAYSNGLINFC